MSYTMQGVQFRCDWCGMISAERPLGPSGLAVEGPLPDGWAGIGYGTLNNIERGIKMADPFGSQISHLCPACSLRPTGDLLKFLSAMPETAPGG